MGDAAKVGDDLQTVTVQEAAKLPGIGETKVKQLGKTGELEMYKLGYRTVRVLVASIRRYLSQHRKPRQMRGST
jgi:excisionase family DNA binding protein